MEDVNSKCIKECVSVIELNQIYQEDCIKFMSRLKEEKISVDVIVTSPPYNISKEYGSYKDNKERDEYLKWLEGVAMSCYAILKEDGSFFLNIGGRPSDPVLPLLVVERFLKIDFKLQNTIHWIKSVSIDQEDIGKTNTVRNNGEVSIGHFKPIVSGRYLSDLQEYVFHFTKSGSVKLDKLGIGVAYQDKTNIGRWKAAQQDRRDRGNVWFIPYPTIQTGRPHPAVFPVKLPELCIKLHGTEPNMLVYDPFMGIGSTALACISLGVNYIGTEIDPEYIKIAKRQISGDINTYLQDDEDDS
ncbi:MAG TPA: site-specific DNA-methyltransferase [Candidatus Nitrosopolaris sp.]|nr:site-specific DNA-methyltransferase [Candidatus Nitrosopolaris sp.]